MRRRIGFALLITASALAGCDGGLYQVQVRFEPATLATDAERVELAVLSSCDGQPLELPSNMIGQKLE